MEISSKINISLHDWLKANYLWEINSYSANEFELSVFENTKLVEAFVADCSLLSTCSFESICGVDKDVNGSKSIAWALIRAYYSAFFAANTIIRIFGVSCSYFERDHMSRLNERVSIIDQSIPPVVVKTGCYKCVFDTGKSILQCSAVESTGGAHVTCPPKTSPPEWV